MLNPEEDMGEAKGLSDEIILEKLRKLLLGTVKREPEITGLISLGQKTHLPEGMALKRGF